MGIRPVRFIAPVRASVTAAAASRSRMSWYRHCRKPAVLNRAQTISRSSALRPISSGEWPAAVTMSTLNVSRMDAATASNRPPQKCRPRRTAFRIRRRLTAHSSAGRTRSSMRDCTRPATTANVNETMTIRLNRVGPRCRTRIPSACQYSPASTSGKTISEVSTSQATGSSNWPSGTASRAASRRNEPTSHTSTRPAAFPSPRRVTTRITDMEIPRIRLKASSASGSR